MKKRNQVSDYIMPKLSARQPKKRMARVQRTRRMQTAAVGVMQPTAPLLSQVWRTQRPQILAATLTLLLGVAFFVLFNTDLFYVYDLNVNGTRYLTADEISKASGISGYNVFFINPREVEQALTKLPQVKAARVSMALPNRVMIDLDERKPVLSWVRGTEMYWIDAEGTSFPARVNLAELPVLRDLDATPVKAGQSVKPDPLAAFWAYRQVAPDGARMLEWSAARGLAFTDERGWKIYLGDANEMAGKLAKLRVLTTQLVAQKTQIKFIDLGKGDPFYQ